MAEALPEIKAHTYVAKPVSFEAIFLMERMKGLELMDEAFPEIKAHTYATKPVVVEAIRISKDNIQWVADWCGGEVNESYIAYGRMYPEEGQEFPQRISKLPEFNCYIGDWVVKFKDNLFAPMSDKEFQKKYHRTGLSFN